MVPLIIFMATALLAYPIATSSDDRQAPFVEMDHDDPELDAAREQAQSGLADFFAVAIPLAPGTRLQSVKIPLRSPGYSEWFWLTNLVRIGENRYSGTIDNRPKRLLQYHEGQRVEFSATDVADWTFLEGDEWRGGWSVCVFARKDAKMAKHVAGLGFKCR